MSEEDIKKCPFCNRGKGVVKSEMFNSFILFVECDNCDARGPRQPKAEQAIKVWNRPIRDES